MTIPGFIYKYTELIQKFVVKNNNDIEQLEEDKTLIKEQIQQNE
ncbi:MAG: hypothetical protein QS2022_0610 [Candidatus Phytoplasma asteris]|uniref:Uncharacterized conserved protein n=1 Tax='Chrysanthemum coronarium' phytoplasma TaxID=1520703 RepID=A0ABQ0J1Z7_9MOLU|nr:hypothetical protein ['Chrysanthemum coronarium' phytoplasma]TKA88252.1 MAG: hypothetical protein PLY_0610 [Periwinkle leaf yellowing phytoplasma]WEX19351.1 MAG: hypothetical protein QS2022_0610 [Candidatus Phytoplasma asteris]GAK73641.1 uncharacterized conserved protein ['Chrysanthemum coronarium' phytoplasma]